MAKEFIFACIGAAEARGTMKINEYFNLKMVPEAGLEPARYC